MKTQLRPPLIPPAQHRNMVQGELRGTLNRALIIPKGVSLSTVRDGKSPGWWQKNSSLACLLHDLVTGKVTSFHCPYKQPPCIDHQRCCLRLVQAMIYWRCKVAISHTQTCPSFLANYTRNSIEFCFVTYTVTWQLDNTSKLILFGFMYYL